MAYDTLFDMRGKVVFAAGAGGAIGSKMARAVAAYGASVAIADISADASSDVAAELRELGTDAIGVGINVTDEASVKAGVEVVEEQLGPIDVLINSVGTHIEQPAEELTLEAWDTVLDVNLRGAFVLSQAVARAIIEAGRPGSHIHVTSVRSALGIRR
ncbi:MAG: SDR family NAD(P)-dependent oxidoreductase, partial [Anaerolineae bacterium]